MKTWRQPLAILFMLFIYSQISTGGMPANIEADERAMHQMAEIMLHLNHYPDASGKEALKGIKGDSTASNHVRTLAAAMMNIQHYASAADKGKLQEIINDQSAPMEVRSLAGIILNLSHKPSSEDKEKLRHMMD